MRSPRATPRATVLRRIAWSMLVCTTLLVVIEGVLTLLPDGVAEVRSAAVSVDPTTTTTFVCMGDSVTYGQWLEREEAWPGQLATRLTAAGWPHTTVLNAAQPGQQLSAIHRQLPWVAKAPVGSRVVTLLMIGTNDFSHWGSTHPVQGFGYGGFAFSFGAAGWEPRIFRVARWATGQTRGYDSPSLEDEQWFGEAIAALRQRLSEAGAELVLLTYALPGVAAPGEDLVRGVSITRTRDHQHLINDMILHVGETLGIPTIDVEHEVQLPETWTDTHWFDVIHLTREGSAEVARVVAAHLGAGPAPATLSATP